jgi:hypothetical protein
MVFIFVVTIILAAGFCVHRILNTIVRLNLNNTLLKKNLQNFVIFNYGLVSQYIINPPQRPYLNITKFSKIFSNSVQFSTRRLVNKCKLDKSHCEKLSEGVFSLQAALVQYVHLKLCEKYLKRLHNTEQTQKNNFMKKSASI